MTPTLLRLFPNARPVSRNAFRAPCPFHAGSNPGALSIRLERERWRYTCFSCGARGDEIDAVMQLDGLTFKQAVAATGGALELTSDPAVRLDRAGQHWNSTRPDYVLACDVPGCFSTQELDQERALAVDLDGEWCGWWIGHGGVGAVCPAHNRDHGVQAAEAYGSVQEAARAVYVQLCKGLATGQATHEMVERMAMYACGLTGPREARPAREIINPQNNC